MMQTYGEYRPTGFDSAGAFLDDRQDWLVVPVGRTRDSGPFEESNFAAALELLGDEGDNVEVHRFGHWGPGWFEIIIVRPGTDEAGIAEEIERSLEDYPLLDEDDHSAREWECFEESWENWGASDYLQELRARYKDDYPLIAEVLDDVDVDKLAEGARDSVSWLYQGDGDGVTINIRGLVDGTDDSDVIRAVMAARPKRKVTLRMPESWPFDPRQQKLVADV